MTCTMNIIVSQFMTSISHVWKIGISLLLTTIQEPQLDHKEFCLITQ